MPGDRVCDCCWRVEAYLGADAHVVPDPVACGCESAASTASPLLPWLRAYADVSRPASASRGVRRPPDSMAHGCVSAVSISLTLANCAGISGSALRRGDGGVGGVPDTPITLSRVPCPCMHRRACLWWFISFASTHVGTVRVM